MKTIEQVLKENTNMSDFEVSEKVKTAKNRLNEGESPVDVLYSYLGRPMSTEEVIKLIPSDES